MLGFSSPLLSIEFMIQVPKYQQREISEGLPTPSSIPLSHLTEGQGGAEAHAAAVGTSLLCFQGPSLQDCGESCLSGPCLASTI